MSMHLDTTIYLQKEDKNFTTFSIKSLNCIHNTEALGLYCYLKSMPTHDWTIDELANHFNCCTEQIYLCINYLQNVGAVSQFNQGE